LSTNDLQFEEIVQKNWMRNDFLKSQGKAVNGFSFALETAIPFFASVVQKRKVPLLQLHFLQLRPYFAA
jgi:hypothetical protein